MGKRNTGRRYIKLRNEKQQKKKLRSKSFFYKYFKGYAIILIVPFITIVLLFGNAQNLIKGQIQIASNNTLNQFFERIDDMVKGSYEICVTIANNNKCAQYLWHASQKPGQTSYEIWEIYNILGDYAGEKYQDIFIYYPIDDRIISGQNSSLSLDSYYDIHYSEKNTDFKEEFYELIECTSGKPVIYSMNGSGKDAYLCMAMRQGGTRNEEKSYTVVVVFDQDYVSNILHSVEGSNYSGISMIHNSSKEMIFSTEESMVSYNLEGFQGNGTMFEEKIGDETYVLQVRESEVINAYYTYAVSHNYYWEKLFRLYIICGIGAMISVVIGILVANKETNRVYKPIELLIDNLQKLGTADYDEGLKTEFEFIESLFEKETQAKNVMNKALQQGEMIKREKFIYDLLNGRHEKLEKSSDIFGEYGIHLCSDYFLIAVLEVEEAGVLENDMCYFVLTNVFGELLNEDYQGYMVALPTSKYAVLVNVKQEEDKTCIIAQLEKGKEFLKRYFEVIMSLGVGTVKEGVSGICVAYEEACIAHKYKYLLGEDCIIDYQQISDRKFEYLPTSESKLWFIVSDYLFGKSQKISAWDLVDEIMSDYGINQKVSLETVDCFKFEIISVLNRVMIQGGCWNQQWKNVLQKLLESSTLQEFKREFAELLIKLYQKQRENVDEKDVCVRAFEYIENHYAEASLSLSFLGEMLEITPSYLSKLFKEKYQISLPDFITRTRINGAKLQLRNTQHNIGKIAEDNGFLSSSVFVKTFKKLEGITPGIYRGFFEKDK